MKIAKPVMFLSALFFISGCVSSGSTRVDSLPMYGQPGIERPAILIKADEDFIKDATKSFGSREKASQAWFSEGERFMREGNLDYAMRRYNQSWLLNPQSYQPYWGFGRVALQRGEIDDAISYLMKANQLIHDPYQKTSLLSDIGSAYSFKAEHTSNLQEKERAFHLANSYFEESITLDPTYSGSWRRWAFSLYEQQNYREAWNKVRKAQELNARPFPDLFLQALSNKMPRPQ